MSHSSYLVGSSNSVTVRLRLDNKPGMLAKANQIIGETGGNIGAIDIVRVDRDTITRDITIYVEDGKRIDTMVDSLNELEGIQVVNVSDRTFLLHLRGKIEVNSKTSIKTRDKLSMAYTPGVARVCRAIEETPDKVHNLTIKANTVAVVSDGTAVLGLGDIGPDAAIPVMEGKCQLFKEFGGVDAFPLCLDTKDSDEIVNTVARMSPIFGGINLEDISAPRCFEIERRLKKQLDIPVFHDDQHGTAVVTTAALINSLKLVEKSPEQLKVVISGVGAAGTAVTRILMRLGVENIIGVDRQGALHEQREDLDPVKQEYARETNPYVEEGTLSDVITDADVFIGLSAPDILEVSDVKRMADAPIIFALANPEPEIKPDLAWPHVAVMGTGRSDYPNQINNVLCFPGLFKGALACRASDITEEMKLAAAYAIAETIDNDALGADYVIPSVFDSRVADRVAEAVKDAAIDAGVARRTSLKTRAHAEGDPFSP